MTPLELLMAAAAAKKEGGFLGITLIFPKGYKSPKGFPRGETLGWNTDGSRIASVNPDKVLQWLLKNLGLSE